MDVANADPDEMAAAIDAVAALEPGTVAEARALIRDPRAADGTSVDNRAVAWLVALADRRIRRGGAGRHGGGHAA